MENFKQLCVWQATMLGEATVDEFENFFKEEFNVRVKFVEEVKTNGNIERGEEGGRNDILFYIHSDDVTAFAIKRLNLGIRWWEDVVSYNNSSYLYSEDVLNKYPIKW